MSHRSSPTYGENRKCPRCGKWLSRFNSGPTCFACAPEDGARPPTRRRRRHLPHEAIIDLYRQVGDTTKVANQLELPRSSVWYAVQRAKDAGLLPEQ